MRRLTKLTPRALVIYAMCLSASLVLSFFEGMLPPLIPVAGVRLGLGNIIAVYLLYTHGFLPALIVSLMRAALGAALGGNPMALPFSACGALLSLCVMYAAKQGARGALSVMGVSVMGAFAHNVGQLCAAALVLGGCAIFMHAPVMTLASVPTGLFVGFCCKALFKVPLSGGNGI